jgi:hypothetical protein
MHKIQNLKTSGDKFDDKGGPMVMEDESFGSQNNQDNIKLMSIRKISRSLFKDIHECK